MGSLARVGSWQLESFYSDHLQPKEEFLQRVVREVDRIGKFLQSRCFKDVEGIKVLRVVKGGSLGKGTCMKHGAADPKLFLNVIETYKDQEDDRKRITTELERWLRPCPPSWGVQLSEVVNLLNSRLIQIYEGQKTQRKMFKEEIDRRNYEWQKQPHSSEANLELFSNIFRSYADQEKDWTAVMEEIASMLRICFLPDDDDRKLLWDLFQSYTDQEKDREKIMEELERWVNYRGRKPYSSDADLVLFLDIFQSYEDQEKDRKMIIEEIKRRLGEWQKEPHLLDLEFLLGLLKSYRDQEKDPAEIMEKIKKWLRECEEELNLTEAEMRPFRKNCVRYRKLEEDWKRIVEEMGRWRSKDGGQPYLSGADLELLLDLVKEYTKNEEEEQKTMEEMGRWWSEDQWRPYSSGLWISRRIAERKRDKEEQQKTIVEKLERWWSEGRGKPYSSNFDLNLLLDLVKKYTDKEEEQQTIITEIGRWFNECKENVRLELIFDESKWPNPRVLQFKLRSKKSVDFIEFDVLPAYDALGRYDGCKSDPQPYLQLIRTATCGAFSPCFTELQRNFIRNQCGQLKCLICLVKCWYNEVEEKPFPPKYALELLTVYAWEQGSNMDQFNTAEGFRTVLWLVEHYEEICIYWTKYYDFDNEIIKRYLQGQLRKERPVILDPADPTANLGEAEGWERLAEKAKTYASKNCCRKQDGSLVEPWDVPTYSAPYHEFHSQRVK
ncbi:PREDICTED: 2'-5'-oligoadenylate synthase 3-like, partial [Thamnophis sirtalis]|uniref:2'-5'-oligoadenylate synthase 3-like n=1 Tax=Thamnophis sirtalis TaxID=35019 RepID=A0A6I9YXZ1_9SAUR